MAVTEKQDVWRKPLWRLKIMLAWPHRPYWPLLLVPSCLVVLWQFLFVALNTDKGAIILLQSLRDCYGVCVTVINAAVIFHFARKIHETQSFIKSELADVEESMPQRAKEIESRRGKFTRKVCRTLIWIYTGFFGLTVASLLIEFATVSREHRKVHVLIEPEAIFLRTDAGFLAFNLMWTLHSYVVANGAMAFDSLYATSCHYLSTKALVLSTMLEDVGQRMRNLAQRNLLTVLDFDNNSHLERSRTKRTGKSCFGQEQSSDPWFGNDEDEKTFHDDILRCVMYHQNLCRLQQDFQTVFSVGIFTTLSSTIFVVALSALKLLLGEAVDANAFISIYVFIWGALQLAFSCSWGNEVSLKSEYLASAAYSVYTPGLCSNRIKGLLLMTMIRGQQPLCFKAAGLFKVDFHLFIEVAQQTYRLFTFVLQFR